MNNNQDQTGRDAMGIAEFIIGPAVGRALCLGPFRTLDRIDKWAIPALPRGARLCYSGSMNSIEALDTLRRSEPALPARGVLRAALFGSVARGDNRPDSDIDILVESESSVPLTRSAGRSPDDALGRAQYLSVQVGPIAAIP